MSGFEFSTRSLLRLQGVDEELYKLMKLALSRSPID